MRRNNFEDRVKDRYGDEYEVLDEYENNYTKLRIKHNVCNETYLITPKQFMRRNSCLKCGKYRTFKNNDEWLKGIKKLNSVDEYNFIGDYVDNQTAIHVEHTVCGRAFDIMPIDFMKGERCPICKVERHNKSDKQWKEDVFNLVGDEYTFLDTYKNRETTMRVRHNKCGYVYKIKPKNFLYGTRCKKCAKNKGTLKTQEQWEKDYRSLTGDEYLFLEPYIRSNVKMKCKHSVCGYEWCVTPHDFLAGTRCPQCEINSRKISNEEWAKRVKEVVGDEYVFLEDYVNSKHPILCRHNECGNEFKISPNNFYLQGQRCKKCYDKSRSMTTEQIVKRLHEVHGEDYTILNEYENAKTKLEIKHLSCGEITTVRADYLSHWKGCKKCRGKRTGNYHSWKKGRVGGGKTNEEWVKEVYDMVGDEYTFLDPYVNYSTSIRVRHNKCGYVWKTSPGQFKSGSRCMECHIKSTMKTNEEFVKEVYELFGDEYTFLEEYKGATKPIKYRHNICGMVYKRSPNHFLSHKGICPECHGGSGRHITTSTFRERLRKARGDEYILLGRYVKAQEKTLFKHVVCGKEFKMAPSHIINGTGCPHCFGKFKKTTKQYKDEVATLHGDEYTVLGEYVNSSTSILMKHNTCGYEWKTSPSNFVNNGTECPRCVRKGRSRGEALIEDYLIEHNIDYEPQKTFDDCVGNAQPLPFDFYIPSANMAIEYDGEQHFKSVEYWGGDKEFTKRINYDKIKNQYCDDNDIFLVRIPYTITGEGLTKMLDGAIKPIIDDGGSSKMKAIFFSAPYKY